MHVTGVHGTPKWHNDAFFRHHLASAPGHPGYLGSIRFPTMPPTTRALLRITKCLVTGPNALFLTAGVYRPVGEREPSVQS
jgi:hypothetical protein